MATRTTLAQLFVDPASSAPAIVSTSPPTVVSYKALTEQIDRLSGQIRSAGLKPGEPVAIVLPNGLDFLVIFLALVRAGLITVLLNPADRPDELRFFIEDAQPRAVVAGRDNFSVKEVAAGLRVPVWQPTINAGGVVRLAELPQTPCASVDAPSPHDVAVFAYTSGTTDRPKCVPLTHANVLWSSLEIGTHYRLSAVDCSLVVLPLFHGHGLIGATLSTLASGGSVIVPLRFSASEFWKLFREHHATWYTAVPTIHQILLARADGDGAPRHGPRFIRSCSAPLAPAVLDKLENRFGAPVLEAYGMTEAAHQVASNPLPPLARKPGTVGFSSEVSIVDQNGRHMGANTPGEIVVRGPNVMRGYRNNAEANAAAFIDGWFRTGDLGVIDSDGYLALTGRIKDLINRGGEKISPAEIEAVLLEDPAVSEAAVFGVPDPKYGEDVSAAVVLKGSATEEDLQTFCGRRLADFKIPKRIHFVSAIPKNAMGKVKRSDLTASFS